jgi:hypothetical protein
LRCVAGGSPPSASPTSPPCARSCSARPPSPSPSS